MFIGYTSATCHNIADFMLYGIFHAIQIVKKKKKGIYQNWHCQCCGKCKENSFLSVRHAGVPVMKRQAKDLYD